MEHDEYCYQTNNLITPTHEKNGKKSKISKSLEKRKSMKKKIAIIDSNFRLSHGLFRVYYSIIMTLRGNYFSVMLM